MLECEIQAVRWLFKLFQIVVRFQETISNTCSKYLTKFYDVRRSDQILL